MSGMEVLKGLKDRSIEAQKVGGECMKGLTLDYDILDIVYYCSSVTLDPFLDLSFLQVVPCYNQLLTL